MKKTCYIIIPFLITLLFISCKKDHSVLGADVQPEADVLGALHSDTSQVYAHTTGYDSIPSFSDRYKFLGSNQDPQFGRTNVGLYTNINLPNNITNVSFGSDPQLVSAEIILTVASLDFVGTYTNAMNYSVFPMSSTLDKNKVYYSNQKNMHSVNSVLANYTGVYSIMDGKLVLRIPVDFNYANSIINNIQFLTNNSVFQNTYKGFYITCAGSNLNPVTTQGAITKFDLDDELSGFYLYYQNGTPVATKVNKTFRFTFSGVDAARYNTIDYDRSTIPNNNLYSQLVDKDSLKGKQNLFLKGLGGTKIKLYIPGIKNYSDSFPVSINRAELILNMDPSFIELGGQYLAPPKLSLLPIEASSKETFALDQLNETDLARYDGNYDYTNKRYVFNIARHVQAICRGMKKNYGFYVVVADPSPLVTARRDHAAERIILAGKNNSSLKPKFNLSYIRLSHD